MKKNYFQTNEINNLKIKYGFFTRNDGLSSHYYASLNCSYSSGDNIDLVKKNIESAKEKIKLKNKKLKFIKQIHSRKIININKKNFFTEHTADGVITCDPEISLAVLTADCAPIFIFDKDASFICCLHSGWNGCFLNIIEAALLKIKKIQTDNDKIIAIIGPCLNQKNFEVSKNFKNMFILKNPEYNKFFSNSNKIDKNLFNMRDLMKFQFKKNMIKNVTNIDIDTYENKELFFSHRRSTHNNQLPTGRMINIIGFNK